MTFNHPPLSLKGRTAPSGTRRRFLERVFALAAFLLLVTSVVLPTGSVYGFPAKHAVYILCVGSFLVLWLGNRSRLRPGALALLFLSGAFVLLFMLVAFFRDIAHPMHILSEAIGLFSTVSIVLIFLLAVEAAWLTRQEVFAFSLIGALLFASVKVAAAIAMSAGLVTYFEVFRFVVDAFDYRFVSGFMFGKLVRVNLIIYDFFVLTVLAAALLQQNVFGPAFAAIRRVFIPIAALCIFFAYSRLLFVVLAAVLLLLFVSDWGIRSRLTLLGVLLALVLAVIPWMGDAFFDRFLSNDVQRSDEIRRFQIAALLSAWSSVPLLGGGFGYFAESFVRDPSAPHSFEVQWLGFLMKFGLFGTTFLIGLVTLLYKRVLSAPFCAARTLSAALLTLFLIGGFTNQYLITSAAAVIYLLLLLLPFVGVADCSYSGPAEVARVGLGGGPHRFPLASVGRALRD